MTPIVSSVEIARPPTEVFEYLTDPSHLPEWQESVVAVQGERPHTVGSTVIITRRVGRMERTMPSGPIRGGVHGTVEPVNDGERSRVTIAVDLHGHGIGKILMPLIVRRQVEKEMPRNMKKLKERLESKAP
jgi:uncharacterized protein YndB with AHSA1/START domain